MENRRPIYIWLSKFQNRGGKFYPMEEYKDLSGIFEYSSTNRPSITYSDSERGCSGDTVSKFELESES